MSSPPKRPPWVPVQIEKLRRRAQEAPAPITQADTARKRAMLALKLHNLGAPLAQQVAKRGCQEIRQADRSRWRPTMIAAALALSTLSSPLWLPVSLPFAGLLALGSLVAGVGIAHHVQQQQYRQRLAQEVDLAKQFDAYMLSIAAQLPEAALAVLQQIKDSLLQLLPRLPEARQFALLAHEDIFFICQTVERYVPDAIAPFLSIPPDKQAQPLAMGASAQELLLEQLQILQAKLSLLQDQLLQQDGQRLLQHKRFLEYKHRPEHLP